MKKENFNPVLIVPLKNFVTFKSAEIKRFQSERFIFTVQVNNIRYKICQVFFGKSDGSIYVAFPYFKVKVGIASVGTLSPFLDETKVSLEDRGKVTANPVKYAHHTDGEVHFSQDGKVKTLIRKKSVALQDAEDHIFTLHAQGLEDFEIDSTEEDHQPKQKRTVLNFDFKETNPKAIKIVGRWYSWKNLIERSQGHSVGPQVLGQTPDGKRSPSYLIGPPQGWPMENYFLSIICEETNVLDKERKSSMFFIGGFDKSTVINNFSRKSTFLCMSYPVSNYQDLLKQIGSIDL